MTVDAARLTEVTNAFGRFRPSSAFDSPLYARLSASVQDDPDLLAIAANTRPRQPIPNVFFSAVHYLLMEQPDHRLAGWYPTVRGLHPHVPAASDGGDPFPAFREFVLENADEVTSLCRTRLTQTNEVGRCTALMPALSVVAERGGNRRLAMVELGASAGLLLRWDDYAYDYRPGGRAGNGQSQVVLSCDVRGQQPPIPAAFPAVASRVGIDINPIDVSDDTAARWLEALIWPEHADRLMNLHAAIAAARLDPPQVVAGAAEDLLPDILAEADPAYTLCIFHSVALYQFTSRARRSIDTALQRASAQRTIHRVSMEWRNTEIGRPRLELTTYRAGVAATSHLADYHYHGRWIEWRPSLEP